MNKKSPNSGISGCLVIFSIVGIVLMLSLESPNRWIVGGIFFIGFIIGLMGNKKKSSGETTHAPERSPEQSNEQKNKSISITFSVQGPGYVPGKVSSRNGDEFWKTPISSGKNYGGWIYFGKGLGAVSGDGIEPALINPDLPIDRTANDCHIRLLNYWPSYSGASQQARAAYLNWLETGRQDSNADLGYVFLYFYGLERRALYDVKFSESAKSELPFITAEIERLLAIYENKSGSFQNYAGSLLDILRKDSIKPRQYENQPPPFRGERELTFYHRVALGQCAVDGKPLPAEWAYAWFQSDPTTYLKTAAKRCPEEFKRLFLLRYHEEYGDGIILPRNKTLLKLEHHPASSSFGYGSKDYEFKTDLPDVTILTSPVKKLQELAESCNEMLNSYSRFVKKNKDQANALDAIIELPLALWPSGMRKPVMDASMMVESNEKPYVLPFKSFQAWFPELQTINKQKLLALGRCFAEVGLGLEPDPRFGGGIPTEDSSVVLSVDDKVAKMSGPTPNYSAAMLTLQLAAAVTAADGQTTDVEKNLLTRQLANWLHLNDSERRRLHARLCLFLADPPKLSGLKSRIGDLDKVQREAVGDFLAMIALADSEILPAEITALNKIFKILGLNPQSVYSKVHVSASEPITVRPASITPARHSIPKPPKQENGGAIKLDKEKIAALLADSKRISVILGSIFSQEVSEFDTAEITIEEELSEQQAPTLMGLETEHSALLQILLRQMRWTRSELEELASDRSLMIDGVLEHLNDTAFEKFNKPLFEGTDPIEINQEIAREVLQ